jgi:hypothetical protein
MPVQVNVPENIPGCMKTPARRLDAEAFCVSAPAALSSLTPRPGGRYFNQLVTSS